MTVAGNTVGFGLLVTIVIAGMASIVEAMAHWFDWIRLAGAAYLVWLGIARLRRSGGLQRIRRQGETADPPMASFFRDGMTVAMANPKVLLFLGAFFPPFVDPAGDVALQLTVLASAFMVTSIAFGIALVAMAARARRFFSSAGTSWLDKISGGVLIGAGLWLALARR